MTIHTTTADENGNFSISLTTPLTSGETIEVTAQKDGQSKTINIQAPSEPYLPSPSTPIIPMNSYFVTDILNGHKTLYDGKGATAETVGNTTTITNTYFKPNEIIRIYQAAKVDLVWFNSVSDDTIVFKLNQGVYENGVAVWPDSPQSVTKSVIKSLLQSMASPIAIDEDYVYLVVIDAIYYVGGVDTADNSPWKIESRGETHIYLTNKNYVESS